MINKKSVLVIFGKNLPKKSKKWWQQFDEVLGPKELKKIIVPGSVKEAYHLAEKIPDLIAADGKKVSKQINYKGYDLWWMNFDSIYYNFCLPFTQYRNLLTKLKDFEKVYLFEPIYPDLFRYFLEAYNRKYVVLKQFRLRRLLPVPFGVFLQILLSIGFLPLLMIMRPRLMVWVGDKLDPPHDHDFRMKFIYEELRRRKIPFVEFIRSLESWSVVLRHAWKRKRPVFYSAAVIEILHFFVRRFSHFSFLSSASDSGERFWFSIATHYLRNVGGSILSIKAIRFILRFIGVRAAYISAGCDRNFHELLACKLNNIKTIGIEHGAASKYYFVSDFMPGFDGEKPLSVDYYGVWSKWWKDYYIKNGDAYKPEQLFVSGPMRPLIRIEEKYTEKGVSSRQDKGKLRVLYISEGVAVPEEVLPYILTLLESRDFKPCFKFRPYRDDLESWLKEEQPEVYKKILETTTVFRGTMEEAISQCDVVIGSYSTAVLEALLQFKTPIFFRTNKWGDHFEFKSAGLNSFFAETAQELIKRIKDSQKISKEELKKLQERFFGDPYQNGSAWVVDQIEEVLKSFEQKQS